MEKLTEALLKQSQNPDMSRLLEVNTAIQQRSAMVLELNAAVKSSAPLPYSQYNRLIVLRFQGEQIRTQLPPTE